MSGIIVRGQELAIPEGLVVTNFQVDGVAHLRNAARRVAVTEVVVHETVTQSSRATVDVLKQRGLGVHFIVGPEGFVYQHADLADDECWHASEHNGASVGIETVNPYYPSARPAMGPWQNVIEAPWAHKGSYVVPTPAQAETVAQLLAWLSGPDSGLSVPRAWPGLDKGFLQMGKTAQSQLGPGLYAHTYFGHADAAWLVLYAWLRLEAELGAEDAYNEAMKRATKVLRADLTDFST